MSPGSAASPTGATSRGRDLRAELLDIARLEGDGRRATERLLQLLERETGAGAAIYLKSDREYRRAFSVGGPFEDLAPAPTEAGDGVLAFQGGYLRFGPVADGATVAPAELSAILVALAGAGRELALRGQLKRQDFEAKTRGVQLEALYDVGLAIAGTLDLEQLCEEILMRSVSLSDARRGALFLGDGQELVLRRVFGGAAPERLPLETSGRTEAELLPGAVHVLSVPISVERSTKGLLVVGDKESRRGVGPFSDGDRRTLELLANQAAIALENLELHQSALDKQRLEREIELASEIQRQILPKGTPEVEGYELAGWNRPARHIGGDYYDFYRLANGRDLVLILGDVSGKGVPAALLVSTLHSSLRLLLDRVELGPDLLARLNEHILASSLSNKFITLFAARLDTATGELVYLNAGHNPGIVVRGDGTVEEMGPGGLPLGLLPNVSFRAETLQLAPGDLVCLYSDGITEAAATNDDEFGMERLSALLAEGSRMSLCELVRRIDSRVTDFAAGLPQGDDQTLLLVRRDPLPA